MLSSEFDSKTLVPDVNGHEGFESCMDNLMCQTFESQKVWEEEKPEGSEYYDSESDKASFQRTSGRNR